jgi:hypothetical protein
VRVDPIDCAAVPMLTLRSCEICRAVSEALVELLEARVCENCLRRIDADPREKRALLLSASNVLDW